MDGDASKQLPTTTTFLRGSGWYHAGSERDRNLRTEPMALASPVSSIASQSLKRNIPTGRGPCGGLYTQRFWRGVSARWCALWRHDGNVGNRGGWWLLPNALVFFFGEGG